MPRGVVPAVADERSLGVDRPPVAAGVVRGGRGVGETAGHGRRQPAAGLGVAEQHVGERVAELLAGEPDLHDRGDVVQPRHRHRRPRVEHDHGARVHRGDPGDQLVLHPGQVQRRPVLALGLPVGVRADDDDRRLGVGGGCDRTVHRVAGVGRPRPDRERAQHRHLLGRLVERDRAGDAGAQLDGGAHLRAALTEERAAALRWGQVDDGPAVDAQHGGADARQPELPRPGHVRHEAALDVRAEPAQVDALRRIIRPQHRQPLQRLLERRPARVVDEPDGELAAQDRQPLVDRAPRLVHERRRCAGSARRAARPGGWRAPARCRRPGSGRAPRSGRRPRGAPTRAAGAAPRRS